MRLVAVPAQFHLQALSERVVTKVMQLHALRMKQSKLLPFNMIQKHFSYRSVAGINCCWPEFHDSKACRGSCCVCMCVYVCVDIEWTANKVTVKMQNRLKSTKWFLIKSTLAYNSFLLLAAYCHLLAKGTHNKSSVFWFLLVLFIDHTAAIFARNIWFTSSFFYDVVKASNCSAATHLCVNLLKLLFRLFYCRSLTHTHTQKLPSKQASPASLSLESRWTGNMIVKKLT